MTRLCVRARARVCTYSEDDDNNKEEDDDEPKERTEAFFGTCCPFFLTQIAPRESVCARVRTYTLLEREGFDFRGSNFVSHHSFLLTPFFLKGTDELKTARILFFCVSESIKGEG